MKVLLLGAHTILGYEFDKFLKTCNIPHISTMKEYKRGYMACSDPLTASALITGIKPTVIINCMATPTAKVSPVTNYDIPCRAYDSARENAILFVQCSVDAVFSGKKGAYHELSVTDGDGIDSEGLSTQYVRDMIATEQYIISNPGLYCILRAHTYGCSPYDTGSIDTMTRDIIRQGKGGTIKANKNRLFNPIFTGSFVDVSMGLINNKTTGIYHIGTDPINLHEVMVSIRARLKKGKVIKAQARRINTTLDTSKITALGVNMPKFRDDIKLYLKRFYEIERRG